MFLPDTKPAPLLTDIVGVPEGGRAFYVRSSDNIDVRFAVWSSGQRGTVLLFTGRTEYIEKYARSIARITGMGFSCVVVDWQGQGLSTRPNGDLTYGWVMDFSDYQNDVAAILAHPAVQELPEPHVLLAHSMGGCIGLRALHKGLNVKCTIFTGPMWGIHIPAPALLRPVARVIAGAATTLGLGRARLPVLASPHPYILNTKHEKNVLTSDKPTYEWLHQNLLKHPELGLGGPSFRWMHEALAETAQLMDMPAPSEDTLTFLGADEEVVDSDAVRRYHQKPGSGELVVVPGARHEILMEGDRIEAMVWARITEFLDTHVPA